ncbi:Fic family protein [Tyzzerella sp. OttesenSCG-928-J15]|nr:Fic family protein [Tyzzerella sp. OttesenSCG-928-J15]MDL2288012.1 Fic family protein [Oscillospiraceae bacterium OttesenSCG-928-F05]
MSETYDTQYCYPNSNVLINKLNIRDNESLHIAERQITNTRQSELHKKPIKGNFDLQHLQKIHKHIFQGIYPFAGKLRDVNISKGDMFCQSHHIHSYADSIFGKLKKEQYLENTDPDEMPERLAYYLGELNALHPFREGNGRTQREFINTLAQHNGYEIDFSKISQEQMLSASIDSFRTADNKMFTELLSNAMAPIAKPMSRSHSKSKYSDADRIKADDDLSRMRDVLSQSDCETQYQPL